MPNLSKNKTSIQPRVSFDTPTCLDGELEDFEEESNKEVILSRNNKKSFIQGSISIKTKDLDNKDNLSKDSESNIDFFSPLLKDRRQTFDVVQSESPIALSNPYLNYRKSSFVKEYFRENLHKFLESNIENENANEVKETYTRSSSRELKKNRNKLQDYASQLEFQNLTKHTEIVNALVKINQSEYLSIEGFNRNAITLGKIEKNPRNLLPRSNTKSINQIISPKTKLSEPSLFKSYELDTITNRFNIKNKRITLKDEKHENIWQALLKKPSLKEKKKSTTKEKTKQISPKNQNTFYNKWFLPVKYWKVQRKSNPQELYKGILINMVMFLHIFYF